MGDPTPEPVTSELRGSETPSTDQRRKGKPGRPRSLETEGQILKATADLMSTQSLREITVDAIAAKAGVSKATVYKWWPNKYFLALDAFVMLVMRDIPIPDTGTFKDDCVHQLTVTRDFYLSPAADTLKLLIAEGQTDPAFSEAFLSRFLNRRRSETRIIYDRAITRGELGRHVDFSLMIDMLHGPVVYRFLTSHAPVTDDDIHRVVNTVLHGLKVYN